MPAKVGYFCILLFLHVFLCNIERLDATAFANFDLDTNWDTYLCANENPIVDEKTVILTATGLPTTYLPCLGLRKNLKISGEYQMSSQLINVGPPRGERNFGLAFNAKDENNYDFVYLSYDQADSCTKMAYGYVENESLTNGSTKSACFSIQPNKWNFLKITVKDDCDHCKNVDGYVNGDLVFSFEAHFATRGFGGALAENGFSNVVEFREFDIGPIIPSGTCVPNGWTRINETCFSPPRKTSEWTTSTDYETDCGPIEKLCTDAGARLATKDETLKWLENGGDRLGKEFGLTSTRRGIEYWMTGYAPHWSLGACSATNRFFVCAK